MNTIKMLTLLMVLIFSTTILATTVEAQISSLSTPAMSYHEFVVRFAEYKSNGNATEYERILNEMLAAEQVKQNKIASTNGTILQPSESSSQVATDTDSITLSTGWVSYVTSYSPPTYDQNGNTVGLIQNWDNIAGQNPDGNYALLWTNGWDGIQRIPAHGGEAFASGAVWNGQSGWMTGSIWVYAYNGAPSWDNYVIVSYYDGSSWHYFSPESDDIPNTSPAWVYIGSTTTQFTQVAVECWTPPPYPTYYSPLTRNYVYIDCVKIQ